RGTPEVVPRIRDANRGVAGQRNTDILDGDQIGFAPGDSGQPYPQPSAPPRLDADDVLVGIRPFQTRIDATEVWISASARSDAVNDHCGRQWGGYQTRDESSFGVRISEGEQIEIQTIRGTAVPADERLVAKLPPDIRARKKRLPGNVRCGAISAAAD